MLSRKKKLKFLIYSDNHWCQNSSIIRGRGEKYSKRLENQIDSINWVERLAEDRDCDAIICAGDFFDKPDLNSEELSALKEIKWANMYHYFLVGNHDASNKALEFNSASLFSLCPNCEVVSKPLASGWYDQDSRRNTTLVFVPYLSETSQSEEIKLESLFDFSKFVPGNTILISHNDLKGVQFGGFISQTGLDIHDIESHCDICFNGHIHNCGYVTDKIINIGNITGQNFSEDALAFEHHCIVIDTDTMQLEFIENPYAFNFYKVDLTNHWWIPQNTKKNAVITVKCPQNRVQDVIKELECDPNVVEFRVIANREGLKPDEPSELASTLSSINHYEKFRDFILNTLGNNQITQSELNEICRG